MAIFLGAKGDVLAWRGTSELVAGLREMLGEKMAELAAGDELALLQGLKGRLDEELRQEEEFAATLAAALEEVATAEYQDQLPPLHTRLNQLAAEYFARRGSVVALHTLCTAYRDALVRKTLDLVEEGMLQDLLGRPPAPYCLLAAGIAGRREQTLGVAADFFLVHGNVDAGASDYFRQFSYRVMAVLDGCGLLSGRRRKKPGDTFWLGSLAEWQNWINRELRPEKEERAELPVLPALTVPLKMLAWGIEERHRMLARLADLRPIRCDDHLAGQVQEIVRGVLAAERHAAATVQLARKVAEMPVALGFFGGFRTEKQGEHKGKVNIELHAIAPLTMGVRLLAIKHGIEATGTVERTKELLSRGHISVELADRLLEACHNFFCQKIRLEIEQSGKGKNGWYLAPEALAADGEQQLKSGLEAVVNLQKIVYLSYVGQG